MLERLITCFQTVLARVLDVSIVLNPARSRKSLFHPKNGLFLMFGSFKHVPHTLFIDFLNKNGNFEISLRCAAIF